MSTVDSSGIVGTVSGPTLIPEIATQFDNTDTELDARPKKAVAETITAAWEFTGAGNIACSGFTSTGIDDNATGEVLQLDDNNITWGNSGPIVHRMNVSDENMIMSGGVSSVDGANLRVYGSTHTSLANDVIFYSSTSAVLHWDDNVGHWDFKGNDITTTGGATFSATYNNQTGTTYTIVAADNGKIITFDNAASIAVTLPDTLDTDFHCTIVQVGAGVPTVTPATDTINGAGTGVAPSAQWKGMYLSQYSATNWLALL